MYYNEQEVREALLTDKPTFDGSDYETGALEAVDGTARLISLAVWKLIRLLIRKGTISMDEGVAVAYEFGCIEGD